MSFGWFGRTGESNMALKTTIEAKPQGATAFFSREVSLECVRSMALASGVVGLGGTGRLITKGNVLAGLTKG